MLPNASTQTHKTDLTEEQSIMIDRVVEAMLPDLRIALASVLSGNACHIFDCVQGTNSATGVQSRLACFICQEHVAILLEGTANAADKAAEFVLAQMRAIQERGGAA